ncbi:MAG TPA: hypothetical protein VLX68_02855 [Chitinivibrionales bacterium]|nr:hypothetical protein [Chitinivibrionales bacterium]
MIFWFRGNHSLFRSVAAAVAAMMVVMGGVLVPMHHHDDYADHSDCQLCLVAHHTAINAPIFHSVLPVPVGTDLCISVESFVNQNLPAFFSSRAPPARIAVL